MSNYERGTARSIHSINDELEKIQSAIEDKLDRVPDSGQPNAMYSSLDMNSNRIYNLPEPNSSHETATKEYVDNIAIEGLPINLGTDKVFESVSNAVADLTLTVGDTVRTLGYYTPNDGGGAEYVVVAGSTGVDDGGSFHDTLGGLQLRLQVSGEVYAKTFGVGIQEVDDTSQMQVLRDYISNNVDKKLVFDEGLYIYTVSPNWAIQNLVVEGRGRVTFRNTGTGDCVTLDDPVGTTFNINWFWDNPLYIEGDDNTGDGIYLRSIHHSKINVNVRGCGGNVQRTEFAVVNEYRIVSSINQGPFYSTTAPSGISCSSRNPNEETSANIWYNPIIEGMRGVGIQLDRALNNRFIGGTSEGNVGANIECLQNSKNNYFEGIDLEVTASGQGFIDRGRFNEWLNIFNDANSTITSDAIGTRIEGGIHDAIVNSGAYTRLEQVNYGAGGGEITDTGTFTTITDCYDLESASIKVNNKVRGTTKFIKTETVGAFAVTPTVPGKITKTGIPVAGVKVGDVITVLSETEPPTNFTAPTARCDIDGQIEISFVQLSGSAVSPLPSGGVFKVMVNGG